MDQGNSQNTLNLLLEQLCSQKFMNLSKAELEIIMADRIVDKCLGCMFGAFIGDALGSYCEFEGIQSQAKMEKAMSMPGGGPFYLAPGQVTDDSEMALHMLQGLKAYNPSYKLAQQVPYLVLSIGQQYIKWFSSNPFDIGLTTKNAIQIFQSCVTRRNVPQYSPQNISKQAMTQVQEAISQISKSNKESLSNGFLMRIGPMACFHALLTKYKNQDKSSLKYLVSGEAKLTHGHPLVLDSAIQWVQMLSKIILSQSNTHKQQLQNLNKIFNQFLLQNNDYQHSIKQSILTSISEKAPIIATQRIGYFKHAYHFSIYEMKAIEHSLEKLLTHQNNQTNQYEPIKLNSQYYKRSMKFVIQQGGDTDTNACIVGGLIGAMVGYRNLPKEYLVKQFGFKMNPNSRNKLGSTYEPRRGFIELIRMIRKIKK